MIAPDHILDTADGRPVINANGQWFIMRSWWRPGLPCLDINNVLCIPANTFEQWKSNIDNIEENLDAGDYDAIMSAAERAILRREIGRWRVQLNNIFNRRP